MNRVVEYFADDERLAAQGYHAPHPLRFLSLSILADVGELTDVVHLAVPFSPTYFAPVCQHAIEQIGTAEVERPVCIVQDGCLFPS